MLVLNYGLGPVGVKPVLLGGIFDFSVGSKSGKGCGDAPFGYVGLHNISPARPTEPALRGPSPFNFSALFMCWLLLGFESFPCQ